MLLRHVQFLQLYASLNAPHLNHLLCPLALLGCNTPKDRLHLSIGRERSVLNFGRVESDWRGEGYGSIPGEAEGLGSRALGKS